MEWRADWQDSAECAKVDDQVRECFFPDDEDPEEVVARKELIAQVVCSTCPVTNECLTYALETREMFGVWGMHTRADRRNLKRWLSRYPEKAQYHWALSFENILKRLESALVGDAAEGVAITPIELIDGLVEDEALVVG